MYISDDAGFDARELATGALIWDQDTDPTVSGLFANATGVRTQLTVVDVREDISQGGAWPGGLMTFLGSGLNRDIVAVDALTGTYVWHNTTNAPFPGLHPNTTNLKCVVFDDGFGADIVIYAAQKNVYAVIAQTGAPCPFWPTPGSGNPFVMGADNVNSVSTNNLDPGDGTVYVPTFSGAITANIYALNRFAGTLEWDLQTVVGDPNLASSGLPGTINNEGFFSGASVDNDNGVIWANSFFDADFPEEGFLYRVDQNGASWSAATSVRSRRATPIIDQNQIYVPSFTKWVNPRYRGGVGIFSRSTGLNLDALDRDGTGDRQLNDNLLTCEPGIDDWLVSGTELGSLNFYTVGNASQFMFSRNSTFSGFAGGQWMGGSMNSTHLVWTNLRGTTVALAPGGADRPRLEILNPTINTPVIFGTPPATDVTFPEAFTNTGCADLCIDSIRVDDVASPPSAGAARIEFTSVSPSLLKKMDEVADHATNSARFMKVGMMYGEASTGVDAFNSFAVNESPSGMNFRAAAGFPDVVTPNAGPDGSGVLSPAPGDCFAPGDVVDLHISIEGPAVTRGPHIFYATLWTNDPDYFLDLPNGPGPDAAPEVELNAVGGCLEDSTRIHFGLAGANSTTVYNNANIGRFTGNSANDIDINGFTEAAGLCGVGLTELFGGLRGYSLTPRRIAMTGPSWDGDDYQTILGNENYCTNNCIPALQTDVLLGSISTDQGATYTPVFGDLAAASYIDSAQDYSDGAGGWATDDFPDVFSPDSTIGLIANETHYGAKDVAELADFRLIRIDVTNRSATDSIIDLVHWAHHDDDIGANASNTVQGIPGSAGYAYAAQPGLGIAHGYVKVPSGCGIGNDVMRAAALDQPASWWAFEGGAWYDSLYRLAHLPGNDSIHFQAGMNTFEGEFGSAQDASSDYYFGGIDLGPGETKSFGIAQFVKVDCDNLDPGDDAQFIGLADLVNKWAGFHRGDVNNDLAMDLADIIYIANRVAGSANGAYPFEHLSDVNNDGATDMADVSYMVDFYFGCGPCPVSDWTLALCTP
ncbi:MAG: hypothetical protein ACE5GA_06870 [Candidatus Zixiibacteriota bacterium]